MKVLHIIDTMGLGGAQTLLKTLFEKQRSNVDIYLFSLRRAAPELTINHGNILGRSSSSKYSLSPILELKRIIDRHEIDVLHCHLPRSQAFGWLLKRLFFPEIKLIFHEHGDIFDGGIWIFFLKIFHGMVDRFIAPSCAVRDCLAGKIGVQQPKLTVLCNCVDLQRFSMSAIAWSIVAEREKLRIRETDQVIGFASRLVEKKGWKEFIMSANEFKNRRGVKFLIAGDGGDKGLLRKLVSQYDLGERVIYLGGVENMTWFYSLLNIFVFPSYSESMGITGLEAQAMGIPVIASNIPGLNEVIIDNENGLLVEARDYKALSAKIDLLLEKRMLQKRLAENGFLFVKGHSHERFLIELGDVYNSLFGKLSSNFQGLQ